MSISSCRRARGAAQRSLVLGRSVAFAAALVTASTALAVDGTWTSLAAGTYTYLDGANWAGGSVATGAGATADFSTVDVDGIQVVTVDAAGLTLGNLKFGDTNIATPGGYQLTGGIITLAGTTPTITTNALAAGSTARIDNVLAGSNGLTITGPGQIHFTANSTYTGGTTINNANVLQGASTPFAQLGAAGSTLTLSGTNVISSGHSVSGTLEFQQNIVASAGSTTTFNLGNRSRIGQTGTARTVTGTGNLIFNMAGNVSRNDFSANFSGFAGNITITAQQVLGTDGVTMVSPIGRLLMNGGQFTNGATGGFLNAAVTLSDFAILQAITNSGGNTINIGSLSGTSATSGFIAPTAGQATYSIGALNTNTTFAGLFVGNNVVTKVGTGTLTLTSSQFHTNNTNINAGTLALAGNGAVPTSPLVLMQNGATFDVSGTSSVYGTAAGQTLQSAAGSTVTIVGPYNHSDGSLTPGTLTGAGRMNFNGDLTLGGGTLNLELSPNPAPGGTNDLIAVTGTTHLSPGLTLNVGLLGGLTANTYTLITSSGGFTGDTNGWTFNYGARGALPTLTKTANSIQLTVSSVAGVPLVWKGSVDGNWAVNGSENFLNTVSTAADKFFQLDTVRFDDTASNFNVAIVASVAPTAVVVDNTTDYTFGGSGGIAGGATLTKRGSGKLTFSNTGVNGFGGGVSIEGGTIDVGTLGQNAIGTGTITFVNGTLRAPTPTGSNVTLANPIVVTGAGTFITANTGTAAQARQTILAGPITGSGSLTVANDNPALVKGLDLGDTAGFAGTLNVGAALTVRLSNATTNGNAALALNIDAGGTVGTISPNALTIPLGSLSGAGTLRGHSSGGSGSTVNYVVGSLNTNSTFSGFIVDGLQTGTAPIVRPVGITKVGTGTLTLAGANTYTGTTTVNAGVLQLAAAAQETVFGGTTVTAPGGVDVRGGKVAFQYTGTAGALAANVESILKAGFQQTPDPFATGAIRSTELAEGRVLGWADNESASQVEVAYTLLGDANLDFAVSFDDLLALSQNYGVASGKVWEQGDFNYDGGVTFDDLLTLSQNYNSSLSAAQASLVGASFAADFALAQSLVVVPEPAALSVLGLGLASMARRRRGNARA